MQRQKIKRFLRQRAAAADVRASGRASKRRNHERASTPSHCCRRVQPPGVPDYWPNLDLCGVTWQRESLWEEEDEGEEEDEEEEEGKKTATAHASSPWFKL